MLVFDYRDGQSIDATNTIYYSQNKCEWKNELGVRV